MPERVIIDNCSPTLAGIKTGNLFSIAAESKEELTRDLRQLNAIFCRKGLRIVPLGYAGDPAKGRTLLYVYRPDRLRKDAQVPKAQAILKSLGYSATTPDGLVVQLAKRIRNTDTETHAFPHEIGLFLGYPAEDVEGFMEGRTPALQAKGYWQVYSNPASALRTFRMYRKCTEVYASCYEGGASIDRLTVSSRKS